MVVTLSAATGSPDFQFYREQEWRPDAAAKTCFSESEDLAVQPQLQVGQNIQTVI